MRNAPCLLLILLTLSGLAIAEEACRQHRYPVTADAAVAVQWQTEVRGLLAERLGIAELLVQRGAWPLQPTEVDAEDKEGYVLRHIELNTRPDRRIPVLLTMPKRADAGPFPAVVCIHGHGGTRFLVHDPDSIYHGFAAQLAAKGMVTLALDVGDHALDPGLGPLMGQWLFDLMRAVDFLGALPDVDARRIGCAGLSLGGELAMLLGAMDTRIRASVSAGFLTMMCQMEQNHCMCWKFDGLRAAVDFPDIYALTAPRALLCQIGRQEPLTQFNPMLATYALRQIQPIYHALGAPENLQFDLHDGKHEIHLETLAAFLEEKLNCP